MLDIGIMVGIVPCFKKDGELPPPFLLYFEIFTPNLSYKTTCSSSL